MVELPGAYPQIFARLVEVGSESGAGLFGAHPRISEKPAEVGSELGVALLAEALQKG